MLFSSLTQHAHSGGMVAMAKRPGAIEARNGQDGQKADTRRYGRSNRSQTRITQQSGLQLNEGDLQEHAKRHRTRSPFS
jgi:hypothetical protein